MRLLVINIYFEPTSFGGATVVAEQLAARMNSTGRFDVTALSAAFGAPATTRTIRYRTRFGFDGFVVSLKNRTSESPLERTKNSKFDDALKQVLDFVRPDVVHVHCVQELGASFFDILKSEGTPFAVTVHDFWYFCERQFMIDVTGEFCAQRKIDVKRCSMCSPDTNATVQRTDYLVNQLSKANLVLTPSAYARDMLIANGLSKDLVRVNKNGVVPPPDDVGLARLDWVGEPIRVGYVGGPGAIKGWNLIVAALRRAPNLRKRLQIIAVDAGANIGQSWREELLHNTADLPVVVVPGYSPNDIDKAFSQFDAVICPSRWKETFGLVVREALVRKKWVIASDAGGLAEDIVDGENGRILPFPPNRDNVIEALTELADMVVPPRFDVNNIKSSDDQAREVENWLCEIIDQDGMLSEKLAIS
ncbi:glycosyltransferase [Nitratireductor sp. XY-223]|uniref:glycosyltransferase n=1 Tax=Nitratireductor sp. XY-223 TaxID=2561926 RepID=UPI0010AA9C34|nr:glycosyltransferase [Nitratireductor sp. XY-223]